MNSFPLRRLLVLAAIQLAPFATVRPAAAQCEPRWQPGDPAAHLRGSVTATTSWDPDGAGPAVPLLVLGGRGLSGGAVVDAAIAGYDGTNWLPLGSPPGSHVTALGTYGGQLVAAVAVAGSPTFDTYIASFDGTTWRVLGVARGSSTSVRAFTVHGGALIAAGSLASIDGRSFARIARFDGQSWSALGVVGIDGAVQTMAVHSGLLYVGGSFTSAGGVPAANLASWSGITWAPVGNPNGPVETLAVRTTSNALSSYLFAGGRFTRVGGFAAARVARYNTANNAWAALGAGLPASACESLLVRSTGLTSYVLTASVERYDQPPEIWRWTGSTWSSLGSAGALYSIGNRLAYHGGRYLISMGADAVALRQFDGVAWVPVAGPGIDGTVLAIQDLGNEVVLGGRFRSITGVVTNGIARGNSGSFRPLGSGIDGDVRALARAPGGDILAGGDFTSAGGSPANHVARWNGSSWLPLGAGTNGVVLALLALPNGDVLAAGSFTLAGGNAANNLARWNGSSWSALGAGTNGAVYALLRLADGSVIAGGGFSMADNRTVNAVARWDGSSWSGFGVGLSSSVQALAELPGGGLLVAGSFSNAGGRPARGGIARWDGSAWSAIDQSTYPQYVRAVVVLPDGDLVAAGSIPVGPVGSQVAVRLARLRNGVWHSLDLREPGGAGALVWRSWGELLVGGDFTAAGSQIAGYFARLTAPCRAPFSAYGAGCAGSAGTLALQVEDRTWLGGTYRATGRGFAPAAIGLDVLGLAAVSMPLSALHPAGLSGCRLLVDPILIEPLTPASGRATASRRIPPVAALLGSVLREQMLQVALGPNATIQALSSSNGVAMTIGVF
jgi:hypothetical protein